jgi:hypothetical protein
MRKNDKNAGQQGHKRYLKLHLGKLSAEHKETKCSSSREVTNKSKVKDEKERECPAWSTNRDEE